MTFRRKHRHESIADQAGRSLYTTVAAMLFVAAVTVSTAFTQFSAAWQAGVPLVIALTLVYLYIRRHRRRLVVTKRHSSRSR